MLIDPGRSLEKFGSGTKAKKEESVDDDEISWLTTTIKWWIGEMKSHPWISVGPIPAL
jgi:hypothetical protein